MCLKSLNLAAARILTAPAGRKTGPQLSISEKQ
ncbi:hypothetical protein BP354E_0826 [Burkholderia pseudomallei 354e]|nr:hypothetical protein BP354E_0826 [Burkholderia pseudomallei 354e]EIF81750.1 hypothetical protein BP354A_1037 [Burkholderia pseudomallei 354a]